MACGVDPKGWEAECRRQLETYRKYVELAKFQSEKCRFPGRGCGYAEADLQLMWRYIENTVPLCGKLIKALAETERKFRELGVEELKNGYVVGESRPDKLNPNRKIVTLYLEKPVCATVALWEKRLYVLYDKVRLRDRELEELAKEAEQADITVEMYDIDDEYKRLWLEVPLPKTCLGYSVGGIGRRLRCLGTWAGC